MPMELSAQAFLALGAVIAALIAGFFSYLNLIIAKETKVSEFRQDWIGDLRDQIGMYVASVNALTLLNRLSEEKISESEHLQSALPIIDKQDQAYTSITLRVNRDEKNKEHQKINNAFLDSLEDVRSAYKDSNHEKARELLVPLRDSAQPLLKYEWNRVKAGEKIYRRAKFIAFAVLFVGLLGVGYAFYFGISDMSAVTPNNVIEQDALPRASHH